LRKGRKQKKVILTQTDDREELFRNQLPCALDRNATDLQLPQITEAAVDFLYNKSKEKGFFLMVEGGQIDYACHGNDAAAAIHEVVDFDNAIAVAYNFYKQHPDETLIVISADHETGGITVGRDNNYDLHLDVLGNQKCSQNTLTKKLLAKLEENKDAFTFDVMKQIVAEHTGLWTSVKM
ncbi:alkaline phosphatase, partial [Parabacteroides distasonis]